MNFETMIKDANPVDSAELPGAGSPQARRLLASVLNPPPGHRMRVPRGLMLAAGGGTAVAAAGVAALVIGLTAGPAGTPIPGGTGHGTPIPATVTALYKLSRVASHQRAAAAPGPGQFQYTASAGVNQSCTVARLYFCVNFREKREIWIGPDGSGRLRESESDPSFPTAKDRRNWIALGKPKLLGPPSDERYSPGGLSDGPLDLSKLPTDPAALAALISSRKVEGGPPGPAEDFVQVGDLLRETDASPALRAALFKVAAAIPGVKVLGNVTDNDGRSGTAIAYEGSPSSPSPVPSASAPASASPGPSASGPSQGNLLSELIFDPATSGLLAEQVVPLNPDGSPGTAQNWTDYLLSGVVDSVTDVPPPSSIP
jgi:hypothetical protein